MLGWIRKRRRLSGASGRRLMVVMARAEEELIRTHVQNALDVLDAVAEDMSAGRALELYLEEMDVDEPQATIIAKRVRSRLEGEE
jgi:hypothetical protein